VNAVALLSALRSCIPGWTPALHLEPLPGERLMVHLANREPMGDPATRIDAYLLGPAILEREPVDVAAEIAAMHEVRQARVDRFGHGVLLLDGDRRALVLHLVDTQAEPKPRRVELDTAWLDRPADELAAEVGRLVELQRAAEASPITDDRSPTTP
jgi:hypothetical protein